MTFSVQGCCFSSVLFGNGNSPVRVCRLKPDGGPEPCAGVTAVCPEPCPLNELLQPSERSFSVSPSPNPGRANCQEHCHNRVSNISAVQRTIRPRLPGQNGSQRILAMMIAIFICSLVLTVEPAEVPDCACQGRSHSGGWDLVVSRERRRSAVPPEIAVVRGRREAPSDLLGRPPAPPPRR